jgi:hypothetical protein
MQDASELDRLARSIDNGSDRCLRRVLVCQRCRYVWSGLAGYTRECAYAVVIMSMVGNFV